MSTGFKGCAVGCSINSISIELGIELQPSDHALYEEYLGVPEWLAQMQDDIFENLPIERAKLWPIEFTEAINIGADLDNIKEAANEAANEAAIEAAYTKFADKLLELMRECK